MREQIPQPKWAFTARTQGHFQGSQISTLIRTFSCFFKPKITCKVLMRELIPQPKGALFARK